MKKIYVGNLSFNTREADVRAEFVRYGEVGDVNLVQDRETGKPRGFAFVEMANDEEAENAIKGLNGSILDGRTLNVNEAQAKRENRGGSQRERPRGRR